MSRLLYTVIFTTRFDAMRKFYGDRVGLSIRAEEPGWVEFDTRGAVLALHAVSDESRQGIALRFEASSIERQRQVMARRGVDFMGAVQEHPWGRFAEFWDTEGNPAALLESPPVAPTGNGKVMDSVILSCRQFATTASFYRDRVGLAIVTDSGQWVEFDTGETRLAVHPRYKEDDKPPHAEQSVAVAFRADDLMAWVESMRRQGVRFSSAPVQEAFGLYAEAVDPDGYIVVFREPPAQLSIEDRLAEVYEDEDAPRRAAIRKPAQKGSRASILIARQGAGSARRARKKLASARKVKDKTLSKTIKQMKKLKQRVASPRGTGTAGAREKPKRRRDPKRAKSKPALGSLKKAARRVISRHKRAVARASKARPVKRAARGRRRGRR